MSCPADDNAMSNSQACPKDWPVIQLQHGVTSDIVIVLVDATGTPLSLDLDVDPPAPDGPFPVMAETPPVYNVRFTDASAVDSARVWMKTGSSSVIEVGGSYLGDGKFKFRFSGAAVSCSGLFVSDVQLVDVDGKVRYVKSLYVEIAQTTLDNSGIPGPITIAEVRLSLRDCDQANLLLEDFEFSDREIAICIRKAVDHWNEIPPGGLEFNYQNFPFRKHWLDATVAQLLKSISHYYRRNKFKYSAGGTSLNPMDKSEEYWAVGTQMWQEYAEWAQQRKTSMNIEGGWGRVSGGWSY